MQSKVSIIVPVYNKIEYIDMMLESVYDQRWDNIELILVNDGATDGTRERISDWEPRFRERGFEVVIVDQENQGIPAAVKAGLMRITGDYVCLADCDDRLDPEYASAMAGWLDGHPEDAWAVCLFNIVSADSNDYKMVITLDKEQIPLPPLMMEKWLSSKYTAVAWIYMIRTRYLDECKVVEKYITDIRSTQEPGLLFPLILGGGRLKLIDSPLYNYNLYPGQTSARRSVSYFSMYLDRYTDLIKKTIDSLDADSRSKTKWHVMVEFLHKSHLIESTKELDEKETFLPGLAAETAALINTHFKPTPNISIEHILEYDYEILSTAIADCILGKKPSKTAIKANRIIGCGSLGKRGRKRIPYLLGTCFEPTELWDQSASPDETFCGLPVTAPNYKSLKPDDTVIVFPVDQKIKAEMQRLTEAYSAGQVLFDSDILGFLSTTMFPQFYSDCDFAAEGVYNES